MSKADEMFDELYFFKIHCEKGFFYYNGMTNKAVFFNLERKKWSVYDYDTLKPKHCSKKLMKAINEKVKELSWEV